MSTATARRPLIQAPQLLPLDPPELSPVDRARLAAGIRPGWAQWALCRGTKDDTWFPDDPAGEQAAIRRCTVCPVRTSCLLAALVGHELGVWGGTTETDRDRIRARLQQRPLGVAS